VQEVAAVRIKNGKVIMVDRPEGKSRLEGFWCGKGHWRQPILARSAHSHPTRLRLKAESCADYKPMES
jgi:hypothetical protein